MSLTFQDIQKIDGLIKPVRNDLKILQQQVTRNTTDIAELKDMILELTAFVKHESAASYARLEDHEHRIINLEKTK